MPTKKPLTELNDPSLLEGEEVASSDNGLSQHISDVESEGDYTAFNDHGNHPTYALGKYQFVPSYHWKNIRKVTGVKTWEEFLHKPQAQEDFFSWHTEHNLKPSVENIRQYNKDGYNDDQLARLVHFKGEGGAKKWLSNHIDDTTENNVPIDTYLGKPQSKEGGGLTEISGDDLSGAVEVPDQSAQPDWQTPQATIGDGAPVAGVTVGVNGKVPTSTPAFTPKSARPVENVNADIAKATNYIAQDITNNQQALPAAYADNIGAKGFHEPGSIVHDLTDPHGNPEMSAGYLKARLAQMNKDYKSTLDQERSAMMNDPAADPHASGTATAKHFDDIQNLTSSVDHILDLQLANRAQATNNYDATLLGIEKQKLMGNPRAEQDEIDYKNKKQLDPHAKMGYQLMGLNILQHGKHATLANGQDAIAAKFGEHSDDVEERLHKDNPEVFHQEAIRQIANQIFKDEKNPVATTIFERRKITQAEMEAAAKKAGLSKSDIANISPEDIPRAAGMFQVGAQGLVNTAGAPIYEGSMRALAKLGIANQDAVNKRFRPGWEDENSFGHLFTGQTPTDQHEISMSNPRGVVLAMSKGVGDLAGFLVSGRAGVGALKTLGMANDIEKAHAISNFATAAIPSYNSAYQKSVEQFGDSPADESKRQIYSVINGIVGGAVMMIDPKADIARDILGETKAGQDVIKLLKNGDLSDLTKADLKTRLTQVLSETTKHVGLQTAIPAIQTAAGNITDMIMDPAHDHKITDNVGKAAIGGAVGMFLPSLFSGLHAPANQSSMNKSLLWDVGTNARKYREEVAGLYKTGEMPKEQALQTIANIDKASNIIKTQLPITSITGKELSAPEKQEYAWSLLKTEDLQGRLEKVEATKDKAQIDEVKSLIQAEDKLRADILAKAGKSTAATKPTLKITTDPGLSQQTNVHEKTPEQIGKEIVREVVKENNEKNNDKSEESVSLNSEDKTSSKTENDETSQSKNQERERQDSSEVSETSGSGSEAEVREATSGEPSREEQDRLLATEEANGKGGAEEQPPLPVSTRKKRKFINEEDIPSAEQKQESHASTQSEEQQQEITQQSSEPEHAGTEQSGSEEPSTETENRNSNLASKEEEVAASVPGELSSAAKGISDESIGKYNAAHGKKFQVQTRIKESAEKRVSKFDEDISSLKEGTAAHDKRMAQQEADQALLRHISQKPPKRSTRNQAKRGDNVTENMKRRDRVLASEPSTPEEFVLQHLLGMDDKRPENKFSKKSLEGNYHTRDNTTEREYANQFVHEDGRDLDQWAESMVDNPETASGLHIKDAQELKDLVYENVTNFKTKSELKSKLEDIIHKREVDRHKAEELHFYDRSDAHVESDDITNYTRKEIESYLAGEEVHPAHDVIDNANISDKDAEVLDKYIRHVLTPNGSIDRNKIDPFSDEYQEAFMNLSADGKVLLEILDNPENGVKLHSDISKIRQNANRETTEGSGEQPTESADESEHQEATPRSDNGARNIREEEVPDETDSRRVNNAIRIKEIELDLQKQRASQKDVSKKLTAAERGGDIPESNRLNTLWHVKKDRIEKLEAERSDLQKQQSIDEREAGISRSFNKMASRVEETYAKNKKAHEGIVTSNPFGLTHKLAEHVADFIVARVADGIREFGNLVIAVDRAIRLAKEKFGEEAKLLSHADTKKISETVGIDVPPQERAPALTIANEEAAKDLLADIRSGMSYDDAVQEIREDGDINESTKAKLINYLDWHLKDQETHNTQTLREPDYGNKYIGDYSLAGSGETSAYLSGKTLADVHGQDVQFDIESKETQLQKNVVQDTANIVGLAKNHTGSDDPLVYGADMLHQINRMPDGGDHTIKKLMAITGLNNELHGERIRLENELQNPAKGGDGFVIQDKGEIGKRLRDLNRMIAHVELKYKDITSHASDVLNVARANRVFRNTYFHDLYADKILNEQQRVEKQQREEALINTKVSDEVAEKGAMRPSEEAEQMVDQVIQNKDKSQAGKDVARDITGKTDKRKPAKPKEKSKGFINRLKERFAGKKDKAEGGESDARKETISKDAAARKAKEYLNGSSIEDLFQKAKEQTKKPC